MSNLGEKLADIISQVVASWTFAIIYTFGLITWIVLHVMGILNIDSLDFMKVNLLLSWFAGTQASIILMSSNRQAERDRQKIEKGIELDKKQLYDHAQAQDKIMQIINRISSLESLITMMEEEVCDKKRKQQRSKIVKKKSKDGRKG